MESPLDKVLKRLGLSRPEFSLLADIHEGQIARVASGVVPTIPRRIKSTLEELGVDIKALEREHRLFREAKVTELRDRVLARREREAKVG
jgi:hypothetical protein